MRTGTVPLLLLALTMGCGTEAPQHARDSDAAATAPEATPPPTPTGAAEPPAGEVTAEDQSNDPVDLRITQDIRQGVVAADGLSLGAKNVQIVTVGGVVTLKGPVPTAEERDRVHAIAQSVAGVQRIDDQLEVKADQAGGAR